MQFDHLNISAPAEVLEKEKNFFCKLFGLEQGFRPNFSRPGYWLYKENKPIIHLIESKLHVGSEKPYYLDHIAFRNQGLREFISQLKHLKVSFKAKEIPQLEMTQLFFHSPAGIGLEVNFLNEFI